MPIRREMRHHYTTPEWRAANAAVRARAGGKCEFCGAIDGQPHPITGSVVVLTVAHLDWNPANNDLANLRALCQRCHNAHDLPERLRTRRATVRKQQDAGAVLFNSEKKP